VLRCLLRLQATEAEAVAVERRMQEQVEATNAAKAQLAVTQLVRILYCRHCTHMRTAHAQTRRAAAA
jgi:Zn finger protein HypA/HybF involved in hydrogenase expression